LGSGPSRGLTRLSPLTWPEVRDGEDGPRLCMQDLPVWQGMRDQRWRRYRCFTGAGRQLHEAVATGLAEITRGVRRVRLVFDHLVEALAAYVISR